MPDEHTKPPSTIKEVGIHIGYMSKDISELKELVKEQSQHYATNERVDGVEDRVKDLEGDRKWIQRSVGERLINWGATALVGAIAFFK